MTTPSIQYNIKDMCVPFAWSCNIEVCYLLDWNRDSAEKGLGFAEGGRLKGLAVAAGGGRGGANIGGGNACVVGCKGCVAGSGTGGGVGLGTDAAGDSCGPLEL